MKSSVNWLILLALLAVGAVWILTPSPENRGLERSDAQSGEVASGAVRRKAGAGPESHGEEKEHPESAVGRGLLTVVRGKPRAGVEVEMVCELDPWSTQGTRLRHLARHGGPIPALRSKGIRATSDRNGLVPIPRSEERILVFARDGERAASRLFASGRREGTLEIHPARTPTIRVVDDRGRAVQACPVWLSADADGEVILERVRTDGEGVARFSPRCWLDDIAEFEQLFAFTRGVAGKEITCAIKPDRPGVLVLGDTGWIEVRHGPDFDDEPLVRIYPTTSDFGAGSDWSDAFVIGTEGLKFAVPVGVEFAIDEIVAKGAPAVEGRVAGPTVASETVIYELVRPPQRQFRGRLLDESGQSIVGDFTIHLVNARGGSREHEAKADARGSFELRIADDEDEPLRLAVKYTSSRGRLRGEAPWGDGVEEATIVLRPLAIAISGRLRDPSGRALRGVRLGLKKPVSRGEWTKWIRIAGLTRTDAEGRFRFEVPDGPKVNRFRIESRGGCDLIEPERVFSSGDVGVELVAQQCLPLSGSVRLPAGIPPAQFSVAYERPGARVRYGNIGRDGRFKIELSTHTGTLRLCSRNERAWRGVELARVDGRSGRLRGLPESGIFDLRDRLDALDIEILDRDGKPASAAWVEEFHDGAWLNLAQTDDEGRVRALLAKTTSRLRVRESGHRTQEVWAGSSPKVVRLEGRGRVRIRLPADLLPADEALIVLLHDHQAEWTSPKRMTAGEIVEFTPRDGTDVELGFAWIAPDGTARVLDYRETDLCLEAEEAFDFVLGDDLVRELKALRPAPTR